MLGQLSFDSNGVLHDKVELAIQRLKAFEPPEGYYVAFSGGKDSQCIYHLCKMAGVKFDAHYNVTSVDPPELIQFIRKNYPDVIFERNHYSDGKPEHYYADGRPKPITMWSLILDFKIPPSRYKRYCCAYLKEASGEGRITVTGVRWAESVKRADAHGVADVIGKHKHARKVAQEQGAEYRLNKRGELVMNDDNDSTRRTVEQCYRTHKTIVNPIVDWDDEDVWDFLNGNGIEHCCLYDQGYERLGCVGCPLASRQHMERDLKRFPKYKEIYMKTFKRMLDARKRDEKSYDWKTPEQVMKWFMQDKEKDDYELDGQIGFEVEE